MKSRHERLRYLKEACLDTLRKRNFHSNYTVESAFNLLKSTFCYTDEEIAMLVAC